MIALKQVIHFPDTNSVEATWVDGLSVVRCHSYADVQMNMLRADLGADAHDYEALIAIVEAGIVPAPAPTPEEVILQKKAIRQAQVDAIKVTTQAGNVFDGDEISQGRMARAILGMQTQPGITINWVLANDVPTPVDATELTEALALAGLAQAAIWSAPYA